MWWHLFVNRTDAYATQEIVRGTCQYFSKYAPVTPQLFEAHLAGDITLGLHAIDRNGLSKWCCFDSDTEDGSLERIEEWLLKHHYRCHREGQRPGRAGHLWLFFERPIPAADVRLFARRVASLAGSAAKIEIFPKQDNPTWDPANNRYKASSAVRLPLGVNRKPDAGGERGWFADAERNLLSQIFLLECLKPNPTEPIIEAAPTLRQLALAQQAGSKRVSRKHMTAEDAERVLIALKDIEPERYDDWFKVGMALKSAGFNLQVWEDWSAKSTKYRPGKCAEKWSTFKGTGTGIGTIFYLASQSAK